MLVAEKQDGKALTLRNRGRSGSFIPSPTIPNSTRETLSQPDGVAADGAGEQIRC